MTMAVIPEVAAEKNVPRCSPVAGALRSLLGLAPKTARLISQDGAEGDVPLSDVQPGDLLSGPGGFIPVSRRIGHQVEPGPKNLPPGSINRTSPRGLASADSYLKATGQRSLNQVGR